MFASSEIVVTFASAFEKNSLSKAGRSVRERAKDGSDRVAEGEIFEKCKVLEEKFAGLKKMTYLCSPFALRSAAFFQHGSLNYWLYLREKKCSIYLSIFLLRIIE